MLAVSLVLGEEHELREQQNSREIACEFKTGSGTGPMRVDESMETLGMPPCNIEQLTLATMHGVWG